MSLELVKIKNKSVNAFFRRALEISPGSLGFSPLTPGYPSDWISTPVSGLHSSLEELHPTQG